MAYQISKKPKMSGDCSHPAHAEHYYSNEKLPGIFKLFDFDAMYPIFDRLTSLLRIDDILRLRRTCSTLKTSLSRLHDTKWNINKSLRRFFNDPQEFRSLQAKHDMLISGVFAAAFFSRDDNQIGSDMIIFLHGETAFRELKSYLINKAGYQIEPKRQPPQDISKPEMFGFGEVSSDSEVQPLVKYESCPTPELSYCRVMVVITRRSPSLTFLNGNVHTAAMNIIAWNKAYSLFPAVTYIDKCTYSLVYLSQGSDQLLKQCASLGWKTQVEVWPEEKAGNFGLKGKRHVVDRYTWVIPLDCSDIQPSKSPDFVLSLGEFEVVVEEDGDFMFTNIDMGGYKRFTSDEMSSPVLRYRYPMVEAGFFHDIQRQLDQHAAIEFLKLPIGERPRKLLQHPKMKIPKDFKRPKTWRYADEDLPGWFERWKQRKDAMRAAGAETLSDFLEERQGAQLRPWGSKSEMHMHK